ncbi:TetR/AcrR family transcriptional regulator [Actinomycetospora termitidis]|uniref:TetR family transcriptional regulator C-terminal domain-containing protein n=1 Tax=Actinomycetospora termitidis TaxID=3053470 RepID=A0ABT7M1L2_9PSEU|nr:TetR family transcriptional regulator C-terminal domain-containing protein [Actinomycetospora sp. Odt1-22]MDL5154539.1 TetR family transcriptional regulator C-terminal domain-containing protein [Actinomycetospora sp. Odt1-22]
MPRVVDPVRRRAAVYDAVFAVVVEDGLQAVSLRRVAERAGLAIGSVRHYFDSAEAMLTAAAEEVMARIAGRIEARRDELDDASDRRRVTEEMFAELLPLDDVRARETAVWLEFALAARTVPAFGPVAEQLHRGVRDLAVIVLRAGGVVPEGDLEVEAERLAALVDGLGLGGTLRPSALPPDLARAVLRRHLDELATGPDGSGHTDAGRP